MLSAACWPNAQYIFWFYSFARSKLHLETVKLPATFSIELTREDNGVTKGVALSVFSSVLFALLYYYASLMTPLNSEAVFGWRMLLTMPCVGLFLLYSGDWRLAVALLAQLRTRPVLCWACRCLPPWSEYSCGSSCGRR